MTAADVEPLGVTQPSPSERAHGEGSGEEWFAGRILLVVSDEVWARRASEVLRAEQFDIQTETDAAAALIRISTTHSDVVGVDFSRADGGGAVLCNEVRSRTAAAMFAVGPRLSEAVILAALAAGADTFIPKDVGPRELVARLRALLRRFPPRLATPPERLVGGPLALDTVGRRVTLAGEAIELSDMGVAILEVLLANPGRVLLRRRLAAACGLSGDGNGVLDFQVRRLREKLEASDGIRRIIAVRGVGFRFEVGSNP
ncbi:MAG: response regulator transcription factor [Actinomycetota bacterium]|nr:response regulator transcription factor [Actinomycetota bacterium]